MNENGRRIEFSTEHVRLRLLDLLRGLRLIQQASGKWTAMWAGALVVQGVLPAAVVFLTKWLVDSLAAAVGAGITPDTLRLVLGPAALMVGVLLLQELLANVLLWLRTAQADLVRDHISGLIHRQAYALDLSFYESSESYDQLHRARASADGQAMQLMENLGSVIQNAITLISISAVLIPYGLWIPLLLIASMIPALFVVMHFKWRYHDWWERTTPEQRRARYFDWLLTYGDAAPEVRLFKLGPRYAEAYQKIRRKLRGENLKLIKDQGVVSLGTSTFALLVTGIVLAWMGARVMRGSATLGDIALFYQAFNQGQRIMRTFMNNLGQIYSGSYFLGILFEFLERRPQISSPTEPVAMPRVLREGIRFRNVTFHYPGSGRPALKDFDLFVPAGQTVALVGENGAGKSTLVKLLCRFYDPDSGTVEIDGVDIRRYSVEELQDRIAVLFQFPMHYHETAAQNIEISGRSEDRNFENVVSAAQEAGADEVIARLPHGYETQLGRWFADGVELSGGEWQRIALARAVYREAGVVVLDEPTSFLDSWTESEWLRRFRRIVRDRTAIIITHRFTTALRADQIHVMREGRIVESGTHHVLLEANGLYARSWHDQISSGSTSSAPRE